MTLMDASDMNNLENEQAVLSGRSYLVVDYGQSACQATLYDVVEGRYRMVGRGEGLNTAGAPWFDLSFGLQQAIAQIAEATGRKLLSLQGNLIRPMRSDGSGVDYFGATVSVGEPLRVIIAGLTQSASVASARKALQAIYAREVASLSLDDGRGRPAQVETILAQQPDVILFVGGTDGGADKQLRTMMNTIAMALELQAPAVRPTVIFGGNASLRGLVVDELGELADLELVDNVRPTFDEERIDHAIVMLAQIYYARKVERLASSGVLADWSNMTPISTSHAFGGVAEYLAAAGKGRVLGIDVGSGQVTLVSAVASRVDLVVRTDKGLGRPLRHQLAAGQNGASSEVASGDEPKDSMADYILDKSVHPGLVPLSGGAAKIELSLASRLVRQVVEEAAQSWSWPSDGLAPACHTLLLRGRVFTNAGKRDEALKAVLDGLRPRGVFKIIADGYGIVPAMGLLAGEDPDMVVQILSGPDLAPWAWVVAPTGRARSGQTAVTASLTAGSGRSVQLEVPYGTFQVLPMMAGQRNKVELQPASGIDIGAGPGQSRKMTIASAVIGLVIDARERSASR